jgi:hypothetical protein
MKRRIRGWPGQLEDVDAGDRSAKRRKEVRDGFRYKLYPGSENVQGPSVKCFSDMEVQFALAQPICISLPSRFRNETS